MEILRGWKYIHAKCLAQKRKEGASGYLTEDVGKFTEEAVFTAERTRNGVFYGDNEAIKKQSA